MNKKKIPMKYFLLLTLFISPWVYGEEYPPLSSLDKDMLYEASRDFTVERPGAVIRLIEQGANVNAQDESGNTPLHLAAHFCNHQVMQVLINSNLTNPNIQNAVGNTPISLINCDEESGAEEAKMAVLLILAHADPYIKNNKDQNVFEKNVLGMSEDRKALLETILILHNSLQDGWGS